ncbi:MAG: hypothetical protein FWH28_02085 [Clostridiales bacterium]|nr:hypothetical protein [Clostridiales bacterium]
MLKKVLPREKMLVKPKKFQYYRVMLWYLHQSTMEPGTVQKVRLPRAWGLLAAARFSKEEQYWVG